MPIFGGGCFPDCEHLYYFLEEDVDRYIQFIKDVAVYYSYLQEFNKEASSAKAVLKSSFKQRLDVLAKKDQARGRGEVVDSGNIGTKKSEKKKKVIEKRTGEDLPSASTPPSTQTVKGGEKKKKNGKNVKMNLWTLLTKVLPKKSANSRLLQPRWKLRKET